VSESEKNIQFLLIDAFFVSAVKAAEAELQAAVDALKAEEEAYQGKIRALEDVIAKESGMKQAKAKNELAQLKGEDPLPLRRAKITQEAALRKVQKQRKLAEEAEAEAAAKKKALEEAERALEATARELAQKEGSMLKVGRFRLLSHLRHFRFAQPR
jgi:hypothetical protein